MVPLIINPIYTLYSGYLLGISPFKGLLEKQRRALHPKGFPIIFRMTPGTRSDCLSQRGYCDSQGVTSEAEVVVPVDNMLIKETPTQVNDINNDTKCGK